MHTITHVLFVPSSAPMVAPPESRMLRTLASVISAPIRDPRTFTFASLSRFSVLGCPLFVASMHTALYAVDRLAALPPPGKLTIIPSSSCDEWCSRRLDAQIQSRALPSGSIGVGLKIFASPSVLLYSGGPSARRPRSATPSLPTMG